jgi:hypothetical protein
MNNKLNNLMIRNKYMNIPHSNKNTYPPWMAVNWKIQNTGFIHTIIFWRFSW